MLLAIAAPVPELEPPVSWSRACGFFVGCGGMDEIENEEVAQSKDEEKH